MYVDIVISNAYNLNKHIFFFFLFSSAFDRHMFDRYISHGIHTLG